MPADSSLWTILDVIRWTTAYFSSHDVENPRLSADLLLAHVLGVERIYLYLNHDRPLVAEERVALRRLIKRRVNREPVAYIVGEKSFWDMSFEVTPDVLVPRPDTECLVESALEVLAVSDGSGRGAAVVWEPATGSGAVILSLAARFPAGRFFASDISPEALAVARRNAGRHGLLERVGFFAADWMTSLCHAGGLFDLIVANPPYVATTDIEQLAPEIKNHEPLPALDGGADGLTHIRHIINMAADYLLPGGVLLFEIGWDQKEAVAVLAGETGLYEKPCFTRDLAGHERVARLNKKR